MEGVMMALLSIAADVMNVMMRMRTMGCSLLIGKEGRKQERERERKREKEEARTF